MTITGQTLAVSARGQTTVNEPTPDGGSSRTTAPVVYVEQTDGTVLITRWGQDDETDHLIQVAVVDAAIAITHPGTVDPFGWVSPIKPLFGKADDPLITRAAFAALLNISPETLSAYVSRGQAPAVDGRDEHGHPRWRRSTVIEFAMNRPGQGAGGGRPRKTPDA